MKTLLASALLFCLMTLLPGISVAQSITLGSISGTQFCGGDTITVSFTATGTWGHRNAFTLQISDPKGSFSSGFENLSSIVDSLPGTYSITTRLPWGGSTHYRLRILAASPYVTSADNGGDITIGSPPSTFLFQNSPNGESVGVPIAFSATGDLNEFADSADQAFWDFGSGATPATATTSPVSLQYPGFYGFSASASYATTGDKFVTLRVVKPGGCAGRTETLGFHIYDCTIPAIPHDAIVVNSDSTQTEDKKTYWVNPGFSLNFANRDTIFAEPGSSLSGNGSYCVIYMKPGSVLSAKNGIVNNVIYANGTSVNVYHHDYTLNCPTLDFNYATAPPNRAFPSAVKSELTSAAISLSPNPARGMLHVAGLPSVGATVAVYDILGKTEIMQNSRASDMSLDLSKLLPGTYYIRIASANSVVTKMVVRE